MAEDETNLGLGRVPGSEEGVAGPGVSLPASPPDPVDVVLAVARIVVVDHELDVIHVQTPGHHTTLELEPLGGPFGSYLAATSVATRMERRPLLKSSNTSSRSLWPLSPWMEFACQDERETEKILFLIIIYLPASLLHPAGQLLGLPLPLHEDDDLGVSLGSNFPQDLLHLPVLAPFLADVDNL